ncbi:formin-binding protein 4-like [Anthonomus grandis grandis]|uniref:formin-binding protein 4-like n=1 Tax=Anthonomus grandis grandis TaxID=2921223 RepID=UPI002166AC72|nr:formin-binding protein 4-like [Anthonomus grandis grandis]
MDATVDDFFNEINKISSKEQESKEKEEIVWQECYDELTGYSYFWNTDTDEVTWVPPKLYKPAENAPKKPSLVSKSTDKERRRSREDLFVPPPSAQVQYSPSDVKPEVKAKVYSIHEAIKPEEKRPNRGNINIISNIMIKGEVKKKPLVHSDDDDDEEKIELITEYGGDSDSDNEPRANGPEENVAQKSPSPQNESDNDEEDDDEYDLLAKIQQRAKELKTLGGELPSSVKNIIKETIASPKVHQEGVSGFSLVAGYNSESEPSDSEGPTEPKHNLFPIPPTTTETAHVSTLFPITQPINVKDFISPEPSAPEPPKEPDGPAAENNEFDNKAFQRKRRIGISLVNNSIKRSKEEENPTVELGSTRGPVYPGFQKGGVLFVKSDPEEPSLVHKNDVQEQEVKVNQKETEDDYNILREKLLFLGEGREAVLPVQVMLIQAETLFVAMKEGGLKLSYLYKWLGGICSDLVKLEKEAAPEGWLLQWDRSHKRYYYQNPTSGVSQWKYPEPDVTRCDDAMDISTTPPPPPDDNNREEEEEGEGQGDLLAGAKDGEGGGTSSPPPVVFGPQLPPEPPSPPQIRSPTPPPPPIITMDVPLPLLPQQIKLPLQPPPPPAGLPSQPLPPGVDLLVEDAVPSDTLSTALDSFYSEIAEVTETPQNAPTSPPDTSLPQNPELIKKKRKKVKLAQGLTMKKKGVSELVEKWKSVQKTYKD